MAGCAVWSRGVLQNAPTRETLYNVYIAKVHYSEISAKPFAEYLGWHQGRLARVRVTQFFPRKTFQPVIVGVIRLYERCLHSDGFGAQTRH